MYEEKEVLAFVQYMRCTEPINKIDKLLEYICSTESTSDVFDYTKVKGGENVVVEIGDCPGVEPFSSITGSDSVMR